MPLTRDDLDRRLVRAAAARQQLRSATLALAELGRDLLSRRRADADAGVTVVVQDPASELDLDDRDVEVIARADADIRGGRYVTGSAVRTFLRRH